MAEAETGELEAAPVTAAEHLPEPAAAKSPPRKSAWVGSILGGVIAAAAGYGVAQYVPKGWPLQDTSALEVALAAQAQETATLKAQLAALTAKPADTAVADRVAALEAATTSLATLTDRIAALEARPAAAGGGSAADQAAIADLQAQVQALKGAALAPDAAAAEAMLKDAQAAANKIKAEAEATAKAAEARAALGRVQAALDSGAAYGSALASLGSVPAVLADNAATGLPTLAQLETEFPAVARAALDAALRANMGESWADRVTSFLRTQTGARSLTQREGSDPDAVLSRAEAALHSGNLTAALAELSALPPEAQAALKDWQALATTRLAAEQAVADLAATISE